MKKLHMVMFTVLLVNIVACDGGSGGNSNPPQTAYTLSDGLDGPNFLEVCSIADNGNFTNCQKSTENLGVSVKFTVDKNQQNIYFANLIHSGILECAITNKTTLGNCSYTGDAYIKEPIDIKLIDNSNIAYVVQLKKKSSTISKCSLNGGAIISCSDTGNGFNTPTSITLDKGSQYAYVGNIGNSENLFEVNSLSSCKINSITHELENCQNVSFDSLIIHSLTINSQNNSAFIVQAGTRALYSCPISSNGSIEPANCKKQEIAGTGIQPNSFILDKIYINRPLNVAYVFGDQNYIYQCNLNGNGMLENCAKNSNIDGLNLDLSLR